MSNLNFFNPTGQLDDVQINIAARCGFLHDRLKAYADKMDISMGEAAQRLIKISKEQGENAITEEVDKHVPDHLKMSKCPPPLTLEI